MRPPAPEYRISTILFWISEWEAAIADSGENTVSSMASVNSHAINRFFKFYSSLQKNNGSCLQDSV